MSDTGTVSSLNPSDHAYEEFEALVKATLGTGGDLFTTDADPEALWAAYIESIPSEWRSHYDCHSCRSFVKTYGGLVRILDDGSCAMAVWTMEAPKFFAKVVQRMIEVITKAKINGVFLSSDPVFGTPVNTSLKTGATWTHLHGKNVHPWRETSLTAFQKMAALKEDHGVLCRSFVEYSEEVAAEALRVLQSDHLARADKAAETVVWYIDVLGHRKSPNFVWKAVAQAPLGWCHIKNTVVATLMDDVKNGVGFETAKRKWTEKMHPLQYMRPQAAPSDGAIEKAEKLVEKLGITRSLERRFARLDEIKEHLLWTPPASEVEKTGGVFGHLRQKVETIKKMQLPAKAISVEDFISKVLPTAKRITLDLSSVDAFYGLTTAAHTDAPPILRWDYEDERNPFAWYFHSNGSRPAAWGLSSGTVDITGVMYTPALWTKDEARRKINRTGLACHLLFVIAEARETTTPGLALFPECMRGELHEARSVIERFSNTGRLSGAKEGNANGIGLNLDRGTSQKREVTVDDDRYLVGGV